MALTEKQFKQIALAFPEAHEKTSYGNPAIFIAKKFFTRLRPEDDGIVWIVGSMDERDSLLEMDPGTYFITDHYRNSPTILVRLQRVTAPMLKKMLERRWHAIAPKKLIKSSPLQGGGAEPSAAKGGRVDTAPPRRPRQRTTKPKKK